MENDNIKKQFYTLLFYQVLLNAVIILMSYIMNGFKNFSDWEGQPNDRFGLCLVLVLFNTLIFVVHYLTFKRNLEEPFTKQPHTTEYIPIKLGDGWEVFKSWEHYRYGTYICYHIQWESKFNPSGIRLHRGDEIKHLKVKPTHLKQVDKNHKIFINGEG